jgi:hypothetical protein
MLDNVTIVVRSSGERTEELCKEFILAQDVDLSNVFVVKEIPFSASMRKSFTIGIENSLFWTFCIDADVLLRPGAVAGMLRLAQEKEDHFCEIQGLVLDKFFGGPRDAGNHLYRTSLLDNLITKIPAEGEDIRPEYYALQKMTSAGYSWQTVPCLLGLHDFEQYYRDIFRKCFVQAHKHVHYTDLFLSVWRNNVMKDKDYWVALQGFAAGVKHTNDVRINVRQEIYKQEYNTLQIDEKKSLSPNGLSIHDIDKIISDWKEPELYNKKFPTKLGLTPPHSIREQFINRLYILGLLRMIPYSIGCLFYCIGNKLKKWSLRKDKKI